MSAEEVYEKSLGLHCGRRAGLQQSNGRKPFALPGDEPKWPRDRTVDIKHIKLDLDVDVDSRSISGAATHTVSPINDGVSTLELDAAELDVSGITLSDGTSLAYVHEDWKLSINLGGPRKAGEEITVRIEYGTTPRKGLYFNMPDDGYPDRPQQLWTQGQDEDSRFWFPCFDYPNERFTSEIVVTVPSEWTTISNGTLTSSESSGADGAARTDHWIQNKPLPAYLMSLVAGEYTEIRDGDAGGVPILYYSPPGREEDTRRAFGKTPKMMEFFTKKIGVPYAWDKYSQVTVADFIFGGMENTSATTMTDHLLHDERAHIDYSADGIVAHELAHQWWGDLLTCRDWSHGWLNEGFATYSELLFREFDLGVDEFRYGVYQDAGIYFGEDSGHYRRPIVNNVYNQPVDLFDRHLYEKGALVLHMLRGVLGDGGFWKALNHYCVTNQGRNVVTEDLQKAIEDSTGRNLDWFFHQWVFKGGHPEFKVAYKWDEESNSAELTVSQNQAVDDLTGLFRTSVQAVFYTESGSVSHKLDISRKEQTFRFSMQEKPKMVSFDPGYLCLKSLDFTRPKEMLLHQLENDPDVLGRIDAAQALAKLGAPDCVDALKKAVLEDSFWGVQAEAAKALGTMKSDAALNALVGCTGVAHAKARRAVAGALGAFKEEAALKALEPLMESDESYLVEAEAVRAVAKTKQPRSFDLVSAALGKPSFQEVATAQALLGLADLKDERGIELAKEWSKYGKPSRAREAALSSLGKLGEGKSEVVEFLSDFVDDPWLRARANAVGALRELKDDKAIPAISRRIPRELDGRVVRLCREAISAISEGKDRGDDVRKLREEMESLQDENRKLKDRLEKLESKLNGT